MAQSILIPTLLRQLTGGSEVIQLQAATVGEALTTLDSQFPGFRARVCDETGQLRRFINLYLDGEDIRFLDNLATPLPDTAEVAIIPAIAGG
ncbi:MAG: MoaD/ThiS family protein [Acidobacteria bacterium]|nr:MoaD/ThiS family protein [Acidobacteriota bacterium]